MHECIFCAIAQGTAPAHRVWEDERHCAFLSIFPNTEGFTVVIPKEHYESDVSLLPQQVREDLFSAACTVARQVTHAFPDVGRTGIMFEGFGVNHVHAKLFPMHGTALLEWRQHKSAEKKFFVQYEGYMSSHDADRADDSLLARIAERIRNTKM